MKRTAWGTIIFGEEDTTGWLLELINPLATTGVMFNRTTGALTGANAANVTTRPAVGRLAFEGLALLPNGVLYYGDENRPSTGNPGGEYSETMPNATTPEEKRTPAKFQAPDHTTAICGSSEWV